VTVIRRLGVILLILALGAYAGATLPPEQRFLLSILSGFAVGEWLLPFLRNDQ
jgi:hypothetical protein